MLVNITGSLVYTITLGMKKVSTQLLMVPNWKQTGIITAHQHWTCPVLLTSYPYSLKTNTTAQSAIFNKLQ